MANLRKVIYINEEDYSTLINGDSLVIDGTTYTYEENALYVIKNAGPPEYAENAGYATNAGHATNAVYDGGGNIIVSTYQKKPLIIEVDDDDISVPLGTFSSITNAITNERPVILKITRTLADNEVCLVPLTADFTTADDYYSFGGIFSQISISATISLGDSFYCETCEVANDSTVVHKSQDENITGNKTFTGNISLGSNATATTPAATDNDTSVATTAFVKTVVANSINELPSPMIFKGSLGTGGTITALPAATTSNEGYTYKVITNGTYGGQSAKIGDTFISDGSSWIYIPSGDEPSGTVTNVKIQATSPIAIDDSTAITTSGTRTISHNDSGVTAGTYKSVTVDAKGHVTGGTNPTTLAGYGITDAVTLNTEQIITGQKTFGLYGDERHTYNVCNFYLKTTFKHVVLYTNLPYSSGSFMPVITLKGFLYSTTDLESKITFYIYNNEFYTPRVLHLGAASPIVYLFTYSDNGTERVAVGLEGNFYYLGFLADIHFPALGEAYKPKSLWTFNTDNITYDSTTTEENRIIPSIGVNHCVRCGINSLGTTTTGNIAKIGSSTDNAVVRFDGTTSAIQNSGVIIDDNDNLTANSFKKTGGTSSQFLKADGSVDSNTYLTSYTETDPTVPSHVKAITSLNISDWNGKLDEAYYAVNVTSDSQIIPPSTVSGSSNYYFLDIVTAYDNGRIPIVILNQELILPFITSNQTIVLFGTTVNLYSYLVTIDEDSVEIESLIGISEEDIPITQIQINGSTLIPDSQVVDITSIPASIVTQNSLYRFVTDTEKSKINSAIQGIKVNGTSITPDSNKIVDITVPDNELSSTYQRSILENEDLVLEVGDTYEEAFGKLEKAIIDDEETVAAALNELNDKIKDVDTELSETSENPVQNKAITQAMLDNEYVVSVALNNLNDRIQTKLDTLISGTNIKTINGTSILGSGNINVSGGSGTGGGGDENVIEIVKVNGTALTPDSNKAVNITAIPASIVTEDSTHAFATNTEKTKWNTLSNVINVPTGPGLTVASPTIMAVGESSPGYGIESNAIYIKAPTDSNSANILKITGNGIQTAVLNSGNLSAWTNYSISSDNLIYNDSYANEHIVAVGDSLNYCISELDDAIYNRQPLVIEIDDIDTTVPSGTYSNIGTALSQGKEVLIKMTMTEQDYEVRYYHFMLNGSESQTLYQEEYIFRYGEAYYVEELYINNDNSISKGGYTFASSTHLHGNIKNNGTLQTNDISIANGDKLVVTDSSDSSKIARTSISFDGSTTTKALTLKGTWESFTNNVGTVTGVKINNTTKNPTSGIVDLGTVITSETSLSKGTTSGSGNAVTDISVSGHTITLTKGSTFLTSETSLSKGTTSGSGNAVTDISVSGHTITLTKGSTFLTSHQNIKTINNNSLVGTGNVTINELPTVTSSDNGKILQVVNGAWALVTPTAIYSGTSTPNNSTGNDGDLYLQTS